MNLSPTMESQNSHEVPRATEVSVDETKLIATYSNFCRVTGTPEELILDVGLNLGPSSPDSVQPVVVSQRIVMNYFTAKRLLQALAVSVQRHEAAFGTVETNVQRRVARPTSS